ncbi:MBL fold metallo-hydrolase [Cumulibacter manganitolerans]|uniref:MBL fold metallo-hydrolase n=1 Tax=Cumulibacter manganitolerans TaxID=1884992 RepID=UPI0012962F3F|nr:MBL fold metallo-hydrolase [Cumulibacter manganitolerans]
MQIGDISIDPVYDGAGTDRGTEILSRPGVDDPWACHPGVLDDAGELHMPMGGFLVRTGERVVLVDAGLGPLERPGLSGGALLESLSALGASAEDITDVIFTHLHYDHVGWATRQGRIVFPNATYRAHAADWEYFVDGPEATPGATKKLSPLRERIELFDTEHTLAPGLDARPAPGHTPGSTVYVVSSGQDRALLIGDVAHSVVELAEPDWEAVFDVDKKAAQAVRDAIAREALDTDTYVVPAHFPQMAFGRIITTEAGRRWVAV